jgi:hypothetical protein
VKRVRSERNMFGKNIECGVNSRMVICSDKARVLGQVCSVFETGICNVMRLIFEVALRLPIDFWNYKCIRFWPPMYRYTVSCHAGFLFNRSLYDRLFFVVCIMAVNCKRV